MGSIGDYKRLEPKHRNQPWRRKKLPGGRLAKQLIAAAVFVFLVTASIGAENWLGAGARYVAGAGLDAGNSWLDFSQAQPVIGETAGDAVIPTGASQSAGYDAAQSAGQEENQSTENTTDNTTASNGLTDTAPETFVAPASGVVVKDMALDETGLTSEKGILIQGAAGQNIMAAAAGEILYLGSCDSGYIVQIRHGGGYVSAYQGLSSLNVSVEQQVSAGQIIGASESGQLLFTLTLDDQEVDPLTYLFAESQ